MYNKKYRISDIVSKRYNVIHENLLGKVCYLAYLKEGERGWFLYEDEEDIFNPVHRVHTSLIKEVVYTRGNQIIVTTENTKYVFEVILDEQEN